MRADNMSADYASSIVLASSSLVTARHYVLAAGGLETARLLLASNEAVPAGMGHSSAWLGRNYLGHFEGAIAEIVLDGLSDDATRLQSRRHGMLTCVLA